MKTIEDHAIDIFNEYPGIPISELAMRLFIRIKIVPLVQRAINESIPGLPNVEVPPEKDTVQ